MSGHSKWSTIKHKKQATDAVKGKLFSKIGRAILIAIKTGGGLNPDINFKLRMAIDQARAVNMPKANVERVLERAEEKSGSLEECVYEGFGPEGIAVMVEVATDNRNRIGQEMKNIFEKGGGSLGGPGSVSFNFEPKGLLIVDGGQDPQEVMLKLMDIEFVEDVNETKEGVEVYTSVEKLKTVRNDIESKALRVVSSELEQKPLNVVAVDDINTARRILSFLEIINNHDDVQKVYANVDISDDILNKISDESS